LHCQCIEQSAAVAEAVTRGSSNPKILGGIAPINIIIIIITESIF